MPLWCFDNKKLTSKAGFCETAVWLDPLGHFLFIGSIACLLLALQRGGITYAWSDRRNIALLSVFPVFLDIFFASQFWLGRKATVPPKILFRQSVAFASIFGLLLGAAFFLFIYFLPMWFQAVKGVDAFRSGINMIPLILSMVVAGNMSLHRSHTPGYYIPIDLASPIFASIGSGLLTPSMRAQQRLGGLDTGFSLLWDLASASAFRKRQLTLRCRPNTSNMDGPSPSTPRPWEAQSS